MKKATGALRRACQTNIAARGTLRTARDILGADPATAQPA